MSSLTHAIGGLFQPILKFVAEILAFFYSIIPSYPVAVTLLTLVIMAAVTPLTVKSTKNMAAMQALGPEMKKLQAKYKGTENRALLNEEMMKLYKEHEVNPASGCLPMLLQMPAFIILYSVIKGITNTVSKGAPLPYAVTSSGIDPNSVSTCKVTTCADPRYISESTSMYHDIVASHGRLVSGGMDFAGKLLGHHSAIWWYIPYAVLVAGAVGLQYLQMSRLNARNPQAAQANPQQAMMQKYMPLIFGFIYLNVAAILNVYFIVSSSIRILTQEVLFRKGIVGAVPTPPPPASSTKPATKDRPAGRVEGKPSSNGTKNGSNGTKNGAKKESAKERALPKAADDLADGGAAQKQHPRAKGKRERKER